MCIIVPTRKPWWDMRRNRFLEVATTVILRTRSRTHIVSYASLFFGNNCHKRIVVLREFGQQLAQNFFGQKNTIKAFSFLPHHQVTGAMTMLEVLRLADKEGCLLTGKDGFQIELDRDVELNTWQVFDEYWRSTATASQIPESDLEREKAALVWIGFVLAWLREESGWGRPVYAHGHPGITCYPNAPFVATYLLPFSQKVGHLGAWVRGQSQVGGLSILTRWNLNRIIDVDNELAELIDVARLLAEGRASGRLPEECERHRFQGHSRTPKPASPLARLDWLEQAIAHNSRIEMAFPKTGIRKSIPQFGFQLTAAGTVLRLTIDHDTAAHLCILEVRLLWALGRNF